MGVTCQKCIGRFRGRAEGVIKGRWSDGIWKLDFNLFLKVVVNQIVS